MYPTPPPLCYESGSSGATGDPPSGLVPTPWCDSELVHRLHAVTGEHMPQNLRTKRGGEGARRSPCSAAGRDRRATLLHAWLAMRPWQTGKPARRCIALPACAPPFWTRMLKGLSPPERNPAASMRAPERAPRVRPCWCGTWMWPRSATASRCATRSTPVHFTAGSVRVTRCRGA